MTFSSVVRASCAALLLLGATALWAKDGLGEIHSSKAAGSAAAVSTPQTSVASTMPAPAARRLLAQQARYSVEDVQANDGSRIRKYIADDGLVFALSWNTLYKPDLSTLLGQYFSSYAGAAKTAAQKGGIQRQFHHQTSDMVVQSGGHLHVFSGYAYLRNQFPAGVSPQTLGWE
jgi:hypothetical protein